VTKAVDELKTTMRQLSMEPSGDRKQTRKRTYSEVGQSSGDEEKDLDSESDVVRYGRTSRKGHRSRPHPTWWYSQDGSDDEVRGEGHLAEEEEEEEEEELEEDEGGEGDADDGKAMVLESANETGGMNSHRYQD
jgi:hypothetical protein